MPRLTILVKILATILGFVLLVKLIGQKPAPVPVPVPVPESPRTPSEDAMKAAAERIPWIWKDFKT